MKVMEVLMRGEDVQQGYIECGLFATLESVVKHYKLQGKEPYFYADYRGEHYTYEYKPGYLVVNEVEVRE